jgi:integrase
MPPPRKGSVDETLCVCGRHGGLPHYRARIRFNDATRPWVHLEPGLSYDAAEKKAELYSRLAREGRLVLEEGKPTETETVAEWCERWMVTREAKGLSVSHDESRLRTHVLPMIGSLPIRTVSRHDLEKLVAHLDGLVAAEEISWKTATNVWGIASKLFADAHRSKIPDLRVRQDNPARDVLGPDRGERRSRAYLWPSEFLRLVSCEAVPLEWRRVYTLAVYFYARSGEVRGISWPDLDLEQRGANVHRAYKREKDDFGSTKGKAARRLPIEAELVPLLRAMHRESGGVGRVVPIWPGHDAAGALREHLQLAGVTREELFIDDATRAALTYHDLRATGITWCAIRGDDALKIQRRVGHTDLATTQKYIREAENAGTGFGTVFPPLPLSLLGEQADVPTPTANGPGNGPGDPERPSTTSDGDAAVADSQAFPGVGGGAPSSNPIRTSPTSALISPSSAIEPAAGDQSRTDQDEPDDATAATIAALGNSIAALWRAGRRAEARTHADALRALVGFERPAGDVVGLVGRKGS